MAYASGTCTDFIDFMRKLRDYAAGLVDPATDPEITAGQKVIDIQAVGTLTFIGQPANGETVTINGKGYTFQTVLTNVDGNVFIGATTDLSASNLAAAINAGPGSGTAYAAATVAHPFVKGANGPGYTRAIAQTGGVSGNGITTTDTVANASWSGATLTGGFPVKWTILTNGALPALPGSGSATDGEFYLRGPGSDPADQIIIGAQSYRNTGNAVFGFRWRGYTQFNNLLSFTTMPGVSPPGHVALANATFNCWFYVSPRRIMAVARIGSTDILVHSGLLQQFGTRGQYPYPLLIAGSVQDATYNTAQNNFGQSTLPDPGPTLAYLRWVDGSWNVVQSYNNNSATRSQARTGTNPYSLWPQRDVSVSDGSDVSSVDNEDTLFEQFTSTNRQLSSSEISAYPLLPCIMHTATQLIGQVEGLFVVPGLGLNSGDTINDGTFTYDVFKNTWRSEAADFYAIRRV